MSAEIAPFAKKIYMPEPCFPKSVSNVLIATGCSGSWSAQINRSDDDVLAEAIVLVAKTFPNVNFIYRCHPTAVHPQHAGLNYINKLAEYFAFTGLKNIRMSSHVPMQELSRFNLSVGSSSLSEDIKSADLVIGEYSHSLIEAAVEGKLFASVNLGRVGKLKK